MNDINEIINSIQEVFKDEIPNGIKLGWDRTRHFSTVKNLCTKYEIKNCTDFNYSFCNAYEILVIRDLKHFDYTLTVKISFIIKAYIIFLSRYSKNTNKGGLIDIKLHSEAQQLYEDIKCHFDNIGFYEIDDSIINKQVSNVQLELADIVTIENCLFDDYE